MDDVPIGTIELHEDSIWLHNLALMNPAEVDIVAELIDELLLLVDCISAANLRHVILVPEIDPACYVDRAVRRLMNDGLIDCEPAAAVPRSASFPVIGETGLITFLIVNEAIVRGLTPATVHRLEMVSCILESLLHAQLYARIRFHSTEPPGLEGTTERGSVHELAAKTLESYLVYRFKIAIMSKNALVRTDVDEEPRALFPRAPIDTAARLEQTSDEIRAIVCSATAGRVTSDEAWSKIRRILFRGLLDPLARHSAYQDHTTNGTALAAALHRSGFYACDIAPFWERVGDELRLSYDSQCEIKACVDTLETLLDRFLNHLGVCPALDAVALHFDLRWAGAYAHQ